MRDVPALLDFYVNTRKHVQAQPQIAKDPSWVCYEDILSIQIDINDIVWKFANVYVYLMKQ